LRRIVTAGEVTRETAADFVNCFDTFLGCDDHIANVTDVSEGFEVRTRALDDIRLPVLREHGRNGVSIILARSEASTPETGVGAVLFQPWGLSVTSE
jgi:hypothetical protein